MAMIMASAAIPVAIQRARLKGSPFFRGFFELQRTTQPVSRSEASSKIEKSSMSEVLQLRPIGANFSSGGALTRVGADAGTRRLPLLIAVRTWQRGR
jgi:hypothetical protein